jgi:hypothetical protein
MPSPKTPARRPLPAAARALPALAAAVLLLAACAPHYEYKAIPVRDMSAYPGRASSAGVTVGAIAFYDRHQLTDLFGFDLKKAGVIPVQVRIHNTGSHPVTIQEGSTIEDEAGLNWEALPSSVVFQRIDEYTSGSLSLGQGAKRTLLWGLAGAVVGAAVGVVSGTNVGTAAGKGAAVGAGAGASTSILGAGEEDTSEEVVRDFSSRSIDHTTIGPGEDVHGFLYFPAESERPRSLNLRLGGGSGQQTLKISL